MRNSIYLNYNKILSYPFLFSFIVGMRGGGKTYGFKEWAINDFLKNGNQFIYLRRYKSELKSVKTFFKDIQDKYDVKLEVKGYEFWIDGKCAGYAIPLSTSQMLKSSSYPKVNKICFDEFIILQGSLRYMPNEVMHFLEFYETVARLRDNVKVIFCGNSITQVNPYFMYFNIELKKQQFDYDSKRFILVVQHKDIEFSEVKNQTKFGKLIQGTEYGNYSVENEFYLDDMGFIESMKNPCDEIIQIKFNGNIYGVWFDKYTGIYYACYAHHDTSLSIAVLKEDISEGFYLSKKNDFAGKLLRKIFSQNMLRYEDIKLKKIFYEIYKVLSV